MDVKVTAPSGGWHQVTVNGKVVALVESERLALTIAADIGTRALLGKSSV
jgi:hypothetical protein